MSQLRMVAMVLSFEKNNVGSTAEFYSAGAIWEVFVKVKGIFNLQKGLVIVLCLSAIGSLETRRPV